MRVKTGKLMKKIKHILRKIIQFLRKKSSAVNTDESIRYHIDEYSLERVTGWLCQQQAKFFLDCEPSLSLNGKLLPNAEINIMRDDLLSAGFGSGKHGFNAAVNWQQFEVGENIVELRVDKSTIITIKLIVTEKQMLAALSQQICAHIDTSLSILREKMTDDLAHSHLNPSFDRLRP
jgi:hypothetical protein